MTGIQMRTQPIALTGEPWHILAAAGAGAVVGFSIVWLSLAGIELLTPLAILPAVDRKWKTLCTTRQVVSEFQDYWQAFCYSGARPLAPSWRQRQVTALIGLWSRLWHRAPTCDPEAVRFVAAYHRRLTRSPRLSRRKTRTLERTISAISRRRKAAA